MLKFLLLRTNPYKIVRAFKSFRHTQNITAKPRKLLQALYDRTFVNNLLASNVMTYGLIQCLSDYFIQRYFTNSSNFERSKNMFVIGGFLGLISHYWYLWLDLRFPANSVRNALKKIMFDQIVASPVIIAVFFFGVGLLENRDVKDMVGEFKSKFVPILIVDCLFWPCLQFVNFYFLPIQLRIVFIATVMCFWDAFLSYMKFHY